MLNDTLVTVEGWLGANVATRKAGEQTVASFRLAATPRRYHRATGEWRDDETQWFTVNAWRALAENCAASLRRSDPVVVTGRLRAVSWTDGSGVQRTAFEIDADSVGHDLNRGTTEFTRARRGVAPVGPAPVEDRGPGPEEASDPAA